MLRDLLAQPATPKAPALAFALALALALDLIFALAFALALALDLAFALALALALHLPFFIKNLHTLDDLWMLDCPLVYCLGCPCFICSLDANIFICPTVCLKDPFSCLLKDAMMGYASVQTVCLMLWADFYRAWT